MFSVHKRGKSPKWKREGLQWREACSADQRLKSQIVWVVHASGVSRDWSCLCMLHGTIPNGRRTTHTWALPAAPLPSMSCRMMRLATCKKSHERPIGLGTVTAFKHDCLRGAEGVLDKLQAFSEAGGEASKWFGEGNVQIADCLKRRRSPALPSHLLDCSVSLQLNSASIPLSRVLEMDLPQEPREWSESDLKLFGLGERKAVVLRRLDSDEVG